MRSLEHQAGIRNWVTTMSIIALIFIGFGFILGFIGIFGAIS